MCVCVCACVHACVCVCVVHTSQQWRVRPLNSQTSFEKKSHSNRALSTTWVAKEKMVAIVRHPFAVPTVQVLFDKNMTVPKSA